MHPRGWTPLLYAVSYGPLEVLRYLIQVGADSMWNNQNALFWAAQWHRKETALLLLENIENPNVLLENLDALTLVQIACK